MLDTLTYHGWHVFEVVVIISSNKKAKVKHGKGGGTLSFSMEEEEDGEDCEFKGYQSFDLMLCFICLQHLLPSLSQCRRKGSWARTLQWTPPSYQTGTERLKFMMLPPLLRFDVWSVLVVLQDAERQERERLRQEWVEQQEKMKSEYTHKVYNVVDVTAV